MKLLILLPALAFLLLANSDCSHNKSGKTRYKGKLEIAGICMNYTIRLLEGEIDTSKITAEWTDETTNNHYHNVFGLGSRCNFPDSIKQGDEFYFVIDTTTNKDCIVCLAYYPTPPKKLSIKVVDK